MNFLRTSAPLTENAKLSVVTAADAMAQMRVTSADETAFVSGLVCDAYDWFAGERGWLGHCCLLTETFQAYFNAPSTDCDMRARTRGLQRDFELPMRPVLSAAAVMAVETLQADGSYAALDPTVYRLAFNADTMITSVRPASAFQAWPMWPTFPSNGVGALRVTFTAGFGQAADVPGPIARAIKFLASTMYNQRESTAEAVALEVSYGVRALAGRYRIEPDHS